MCFFNKNNIVSKDVLAYIEMTHFLICCSTVDQFDKNVVDHVDFQTNGV